MDDYLKMIGGDHEDIAVRKVDKAQNAVDHRIADGDQRILAAGRNARQDIGQPLLENTHRGTSCYLLIAMSKPRTAH